MAQILVRNLDDSVKERLRRTAAAHGRSMEEEVRVILHTVLTAEVSAEPPESHVALTARIQSLLVGVDFPPEYFDALDEIRQGSTLVDEAPRTVTFDT